MALIQLIRDEFGQMYEGKHCKDCKEIKPVIEFRKSGKYYNSYCKDCFRIRNRASQSMRNKNPVNIEKAKVKREAKKFHSDSDSE